jgi:hypothetical protein
MIYNLSEFFEFVLKKEEEENLLFQTINSENRVTFILDSNIEITYELSEDLSKCQEVNRNIIYDNFKDKKNLELF